MADDSSSDSDIGKQLAACHQRTQIQLADDTDSDDDSDVSGIQIYGDAENRFPTQRNRLQRNSQNNAVIALHQKREMDELLKEDDSDDDGMGIVPAAAGVQKRSQSRCYDIESSSDEEIDVSSEVKRASRFQSVRKEALGAKKAQNLDDLCKSVAKPSEVIDLEELDEHASLRHVTIRIDGFPAVNISVPETDTAHVLLQKTLEELKLPPTTSIGCLRFGERTFKDHQIIMELPSSCDVTAKIVGTAVSKPKKADIGPRLRLQVRTGSNKSTETVSLGAKQPLRVLGYARLCFDGESLDLDKMPTFYELEEDDLLDTP